MIAEAIDVIVSNKCINICCFYRNKVTVIVIKVALVEVTFARKLLSLAKKIASVSSYRGNGRCYYLLVWYNCNDCRNEGDSDCFSIARTQNGKKIIFTDFYDPCQVSH